tara:strand:+ start:655 stop:798 length:144 start_codon:yes stop_codon:yes gene_type:complete
LATLDKGQKPEMTFYKAAFLLNQQPNKKGCCVEAATKKTAGSASSLQ